MKTAAWIAVGIAVLTSLSASDEALAGQWTTKSGFMTTQTHDTSKKTPCSLIELTINLQLDQTPARITIDRYHAICDRLTSEWGPAVLDIEDGKVFENGKRMGTFDGETLLVRERGGGALYAFMLKLTPEADGKQSLETYYGVKHAAGTLVIEGTLKSTE